LVTEFREGGNAAKKLITINIPSIISFVYKKNTVNSQLSDIQASGNLTQLANTSKKC
jgi:hypothetical protein